MAANEQSDGASIMADVSMREHIRNSYPVLRTRDDEDVGSDGDVGFGVGVKAMTGWAVCGGNRFR